MRHEVQSAYVGGLSSGEMHDEVARAGSTLVDDAACLCSVVAIYRVEHGGKAWYEFEVEYLGGSRVTVHGDWLSFDVEAETYATCLCKLYEARADLAEIVAAVRLLDEAGCFALGVGPDFPRFEEASQAMEQLRALIGS